MYKQISWVSACLLTSNLLVATISEARAEDTGKRGGSKISAAERPAFCKQQAAKNNLTGEAAERYIAKCSAPVADTADSGARKLQGRL